MGMSATSLVQAVMADEYPSSPAAIVDYGLDGRNDTQRCYAALYHAIRKEGVTDFELHQALLKNNLTEFVRSRNPDKGVQFKTVDDDLGFEYEDEILDSEKAEHEEITSLGDVDET